MIKAPTLRLCFAFFAATTTVVLAQPAPTADAVNEAVYRQANTIILRQKLAEAQSAEARKDYTTAAKLYEEAWSLVQKIGSGIDAETEQTVRGSTALRMMFARDASKRGDLKEADTQVRLALRVNPKDPEAVAFKQANDAALQAAYPRTPHEQVQIQAEAAAKDRVEAAKLVQDGKLLWEAGKLEEAEAKLKQASKMDPANFAAKYYMDLVKDARYKQAAGTREANSKTALLQVEKAWEESPTKQLLPQPNPYARTNLVHIGKGRQSIISKLDRIKMNEVKYDGLPLSEVINDLYKQAKDRDPDKRGINFIINPNVETAAPQFPQQPQVDPTTGLPLPTPGPAEAVDVASISIKILPALSDVRLADVLEAIVKVAEKPIKYSIEEYAVVFSARGAELQPLTTRVFKVDPNTFYQGLQGVYGEVVGDVQAGSSGTSGGGGRGGSGGQGQGTQGAVVPRINVAGSVTGGSSGGGGGGGRGGGGQGGQGGGLNFITTTNDMAGVSAAVLNYFLALGVDLNPPKTLFWNDRAGKLIVRATEQDLDIIQSAIEVLNETPPQINIRTRFIDVYQDDARALGFDWYLGNFLFGGDKIGVQAGTAPSYTGQPTAANPAGTFPGVFVPGATTGNQGGQGGQGGTVTGTGTGTGNGIQSASTLIAPAASDANLSSGLRNVYGQSGGSIPALATMTGILTDPQFRVVIRALEQRKGGEVLLAPEVTTISGRQAQVQMVDIRAIVTGVDNQQTGTGGGGGLTGTGGAGAIGSTINYNVQMTPFGPTLDVLPVVCADGYTIQMTILPTVTEFGGYDDPGGFVPQAQSVSGGGGGVGLPITALLPLPTYKVRQVTTTCIVWDGQTIVLGGLMSEYVTKFRDKVPVLGDLPWLGRLFRSESDETRKKNLLVFVTPTIIDPAGNRLHSDEEMPFAQTTIPPQTRSAE